jgi:hypothetical protein
MVMGRDEMRGLFNLPATALSAYTTLVLVLIFSVGCAQVDKAVDLVRKHPEHCEAAVAVVSAAVYQGWQVPDEEVDRIIHKVQAALFISGLCHEP